MRVLPEVHLAPAEAEVLDEFLSSVTNLDELESLILDCGDIRTRLRTQLSGFCELALALWRAEDHFIIRNVPARPDGAPLLALASILFPELKTYRGRRIVKHFRMSPWTRALSHTLADGHFHTDINTAAVPPHATLMQCLAPDPSAPRHGQLRVARLSSLMDALRACGDTRTSKFLTEDTVLMVNETSPDCWRGRISDGSAIRFHPETLRAGEKRYGRTLEDLESCLNRVHEMALSVSVPIDLRAGEILAVSNHRALHQRGSCTVRFRSFPRDFESRSVAVLHAMSEPG